MMEAKKVNLFVVGAMKAGTTSFMKLLSQHPDIYIPPIKEPHYFIDSLPKFLFEPSRFFSEDDYFQQDFPNFRHMAKLKSAEHYKKLYSLGANETYFVDGSTVYLAAKESPELIYNYNPESRILILLRNPLDRMYSHYLMVKGLSRESRGFEEVVKTEISQFNKGTLPWYSYLGLSLYKDQVERFKDRFKHVMVVSFESLTSQPDEVLLKVSQFLAINDFPNTNLTHANVTRRLKYAKLFYFLKRIGLKDYFSRVFGKKIRQRLFKAISTSEKEKMQLSEDSLRQLKAIFDKESGL